ncbi:mucin-2-like [Hyperolius riggenbachi]|uniref:mucin-2-like n=1 Tax=Hyperolius riggenbachi TaxID=752182 RepID=UPI0035A2CA5E
MPAAGISERYKKLADTGRTYKLLAASALAWIQTRNPALQGSLSAVTLDPSHLSSVSASRNNSRGVLQKADPTSQGNQDSEATLYKQQAAERKAPRVKCEVFPCFNGGECVQKKLCDCSRYNASGSRCQIVYNAGLERENICRTWGQYHYETFDGVYYFYPGKFTYDLLRQNDPDEQSFAVQVHNDPDCVSLPYSCMRSVSLYFTGVGEIKLQSHIVLYNGIRVALPYTVGNVKVQAVSDYIILRQQYVFSLAWDGNSSVYVKMSPDYFGRTHGLCGNNNWTPQDDLVTSYGKLTENIEEFVNSWREDLPHKSAAQQPTPFLYEPACARSSLDVKQTSQSLCSALLNHPFLSCHDLVSPFPFMASCVSDLCMSDCDIDTWCRALTEYARSCSHAGHPLHSWRETYKQCAVPCDADLVYNECIACCPNSCQQRKQCIDSEISCVDGCYCSEGMIYENGSCVHPSECPCDFHGIPYPAASVVREQCNNCTCSGGKWICTNVTCPVQCSVTGDFHIVTFDGRKYTFQAPCQYILAKSLTSGTFTVSLQNAACGQDLDGSCIQAVTINLHQDQRKQVTLTQAGDVLVYDQYKVSLPYTDDIFKVRRLSSVFVHVKTDIGLQLLYDWQGLRLYLELDGRWKDDTVGLCGTFSDNTQDDFLSPVGVTESTPQLFGNSWKTSSACGVDFPSSQLDPCDVHLQAASFASESCSIVTRDVFSPCHPYLSPVSYYEQCRRDTCKCGEACLCSALAHYAYQCRRYGVIIDFRGSFPDCGLSCQHSMVYGTCVTPCDQTCQSLSAGEDCTEECIEGCACPEGMYLNTELEMCVERSQCPCYVQGIDYQPGENIITSLGRCLCRDGVMNCESSETASECPPGLLYYNCSQPDVDIELSRERTCENLLLNITASSHLPCVSGCICPRGLVKHGSECFAPEACPCSWKGKEYFPGDIVNSSCHTCVCHHGSFQCSFQPCPAMCTVYGDRHFRTFDGLVFDFLGACKVHLVKALAPTSFSVVVENVNCYSAGIICRRAIYISVGQSVVLFDDDSGNPSAASFFDKHHEVHTWQAGFFSFVHFPREEITILWDQRTTVHIQVGPRWQELLVGLCGNYDLKTVNEMRTPDNFELTNPQDFGGSWAAAECSDSPDPRHPCSLNPLREPFAKKECSILLSEVFEACHPVVDVTWFYSNCLSDTCGCNRGGDCECFCTSVSAYAHQCCQQGVAVEWRSPRVCPYDCEFYNKVLGKGPYRLLSYLDQSLVLSVRLLDASVAAVRDDGAISGRSVNFMLTPGLDKLRPHDRNLISLELADRPNYFLCVSNNGTLLVSKWQRSEVFQSLCTFRIHQSAWISGFSAFESIARPRYFLRISPSIISLRKYHHSLAFRRSTLFKLSESKPRGILRSTCEWRYDACTSACFRTCRDPAGEHCRSVPKVEGCIPQCSPEMVLDEVTGKCVYFQDCIEPAVGVTALIYPTKPEGLTTETTEAGPQTTVSIPSTVTLHKVYTEGHTTVGNVTSSITTSTLLLRSPVTTSAAEESSSAETPEVPETIRTVTKHTTGSHITLALNITELTAVTAPISPSLHPEVVTTVIHRTPATSIKTEATSEVPTTKIVSLTPITSGAITAATSSAVTIVLTKQTSLLAPTNVTSMGLPPLVTTVLTSERATPTSMTQTTTTAFPDHTTSPRFVPTTSEPYKDLHTSSTTLLYPMTGPSSTKFDHSPPASEVSLIPSTVTPTPSSTSTPYSLVSSSGIKVTPLSSTAKLTETRRPALPSTTQTTLMTTQLVTLESEPSSTSISHTRSAATEFIDKPKTISEVLSVSSVKTTKEPSYVEITKLKDTSSLATTKYSTSTELTSEPGGTIPGTTLSLLPSHSIQTAPQTVTSKYSTVSSEPTSTLVSETSEVKTTLSTTVSTPSVIFQTSTTPKTKPTETTEALSTSSTLAAPFTSQVSLSTSSIDIHLATKPKPRVTDEEITTQSLEVIGPISKPINITSTTETLLTSSTYSISTTKTHELPSTATTLGTVKPHTEATSTKEFTTSIQELSNITGYLKSIPYTERTLLPTDTFVHDTAPPSVRPLTSEGVSERTSHTELAQATLIKTSTALSTKNLTTYLMSSTSRSPSDETSTSVSVMTPTYHVTETSRLTKTSSQQTYSTISISLSPAVSYTTTQLTGPVTTKGKPLLTDAINTTHIPTSVSPLSTGSTPVGRPTDFPLLLTTMAALPNVTESVNVSAGKTESLFVPRESTTEWRSLSTAKTYKTTSQLISAFQPTVASETLATYQPTVKESTSPGPVFKETQTSSVTIIRDTVSGTPPPAYLSSTKSYPLETMSSGQLTSQQALQTDMVTNVTLLPGMTPEITQLPGVTLEITQLPGVPPEVTQQPAGPPETSQVPAEVTKIPAVSPKVTQLPAVPPEVTHLPGLPPEVTQLPGVTPEVTQQPGVAPEVTEQPGVTHKTTEFPGVTPKISHLPGITHKVTHISDVTAEITQFPNATEKITQLPGIAPEVTHLQTVTLEITKFPSVTPEITEFPSLTTQVTKLPPVTHEVTQLPSVALETTQPLGVALETTQLPGIGPEVTLLSSVTPKITQVPGMTPETTRLLSVTPEITHFPRVTTRITKLPGGTAEITQLPGFSPEITHLPGVTTKITQPPGVTLETTSLPGVTPELTQLPGVTLGITELPSVTPRTTKLLSVPPAITHLPVVTPEITQFSGVTPKTTQLPAVTPEITQLPGVTTKTTQVLDVTPEITHLTALTLEVTQFPGVTIKTTQLPVVTPEITQLLGVTTKITQVLDVTPEITHFTALTPEMTQFPGVTSKTTQPPAVTPEITQLPGVATKTTQVLYVTPETTQLTALTPEMTQFTGVTSKTTQVLGVTPETTQLAYVTTKSTLLSDVTSKTTQPLDLTFETPQLSGVTLKPTQFPSVIPEITKLPPKTTELLGVTPKTTQLPSVTPKTTQLPGVTPKTTQLPGVTPKTTQLPGVTPKTTQLPGVTSKTTQLTPGTTSLLSVVPETTQIKEPAPKTTEFPSVTSKTTKLPGVTPEVLQFQTTLEKISSEKSVITKGSTSLYPTIPQTSQTVTLPTQTHVSVNASGTTLSEVTSPPITHSATNRTSIATSELTTILEIKSSQIPLTSTTVSLSTSTGREIETTYHTELTGVMETSAKMTVSAMLPSQESATLQACIPYTENECIKHICVDGQLIQVNKSQHCPYNVTQPSCGLLGFAVRINGDRCCPKWECACRCSLFSDLSFATFDGQYLALYKEASYIVTLTEDESITVQVSRCHHTVLGNVSDITLCLSMLELTYLSHQIIIDRLSRKVMVNSRIAWPMVRKYGYRILDTGNMYLIDTPSNVKIQWFHSTGLMIIESNSTSKLSSMGLCGLCDGNATNDLILPNGRVLTKSDDTEEFLDSWQVPYTLTYVGKERHQDLNCSAVDCSPCFQMILNQTFSSCHPYVSPESFCDLWVQDVDFIQDPCKALTAYTAMCHKFNVCIEWRSSEFCPFHCPESLVYRPCLPVCDVPRTCQNNEIDLYETESCSALTEGCVCAQGDILHRPYSAMCIPERKCACTDSAGVPREIGEMWNTSVSGCCMYKCVENDTIVPARYNCSDTREPGCRRYGEITVTVSDNKTCCPRHMCVCNQSVCDDLIPLCAPHEKVVTYYQEESCCPRYTCECDPDRCSTMEERPRCKEDQTLFVVPDNNTCCFRHFCGCSVCPQTLPTCQEGEILTITGNDTDRCCPIYQCVCDTSRCPDVTCDLGMTVLEMWTPGSCCPYRTCECSCDKVPKPECNLGEKLQINEEFTNSAANPCNCTIYKCESKPRGILRSTCEWRYDACTSACFRTCRDPAGEHCRSVPKVEGCIPQCSPEMVLDEVTGKCVYFQDCIEPAVGVTALIYPTKPEGLTTETTEAGPQTTVSIPSTVTLHKVYTEVHTTVGNVTSSITTSTLLLRSPVTTSAAEESSSAGTPEVPETIRTVTKHTTGSHITLALNITELTAVTAPISPSLHPEVVTTVIHRTPATSIKTEATSEVPTTKIVSLTPITSGAITAATSSAVTIVLTKQTSLLAPTNVTSMGLPPLVTTVLTSERATPTSMTQTTTTVFPDHTTSPRFVPTTSEPYKDLHTSSTTLLYPMTGPSSTKFDHSPPASEVSLIPSTVTPTPSSTSTPYSLVSSSGIKVTPLSSTAKLTETRRPALPSTKQTTLMTTQLVTLESEPSSTSISHTRSAATEFIDKPKTISEVLSVSSVKTTKEPSYVEITKLKDTSSLATTKYSTSTELTSEPGGTIPGTTLSLLPSHSIQTAPQTVTSKYSTVSSEPTSTLVSETSEVKTTLSTTVSTPSVIFQTSTTPKTKPTETTEALSTSSTLAAPFTSQVSLSTSSIDIHLATKPKPRVTDEEITTQSLEVIGPISKPINITSTTETLLTSSTYSISTTKTHELPSTATTLGTVKPHTEATSTKEFTTSIQELSNITGYLKSIPYTERTLLPTDTFVHDTAPPSVRPLTSEGVSERTSHTELAQATLIKTSTALSTKNLTTYLMSSTSRSPSDETSTSVSVMTPTYHVTETSRLTKTSSQQTYSTISISLSPAVSYTTTQLTGPVTTKGKPLLTDAINTTHIPTSVSPLSTGSTPVGRPTDFPLLLTTMAALPNVTESVNVSAGKTESLFVPRESTTEWRSLSTAKTYKTTSQLISAFQPTVASETLATYQPTVKESTSPGPVFKETQTSSVTIIRDTVSGTPPPAYLSSTKSYPLETMSSGQLTSQQALQTDMVTNVTLLPGMTPEITQLPGVTLEITQLPGVPPEVTQQPAGPPETSQVPAEVTKIPAVSPKVTQLPAVPPEVTHLPGLPPEVTQLPGVTPEVTQQPGVAPEVTEQPGVTHKTTEFPGVTPKISHLPGITHKVTHISDVTAEITQFPNATEKITQLPGIAPEVTHLQTVTLEITKFPSVTPEITEFPSLTTQVTKLPPVTHEVTQLPSVALETTQPLGVALETTQLPGIGPEVTLLSSVTPKITQVPGMTPETTRLLSVTPEITHFPRVTTRITKLPGGTAEITQLPGFSPEITHLPGVTTKITQPPGVTLETTSLPGVTPELTQLPGVTLGITELPSVTPRTTKLLSVPPAITHLPVVTPEITQFSGVTPKTTQLPAVTPEITQLPGVTTKTTQVLDVTPEITHLTALTLEVTQFPGVTIKTTQLPVVTPEITQLLGVTTKITQVLDVTPEITHFTALTPEMTQFPGVTSKTTQPPAVTPEITQLPGVATKTTQVLYVTPETTQLTALTPEMTQFTGVTSKTTQVLGVTPETTQLAYVTTKSTLLSDVTSKTTQPLDLTFETPQLSGVTLKPTQFPSVIPEITKLPPKTTELLGVTPKTTQLPSVTPKTTQLPGVTPKTTQLPGVTPKTTQLPGVTPKTTQLPGVTSKTTQLTPGTTSLLSVVPETTQIKEPAPKTTEFPSVTSKTTKLPGVTPEVLQFQTTLEKISSEKSVITKGSTSLYPTIPQTSQTVTLPTQTHVSVNASGTTLSEVTSPPITHSATNRTSIATSELTTILEIKSSQIPLTSTTVSLSTSTGREIETTYHTELTGVMETSAKMTVSAMLPSQESATLQACIPYTENECIKHICVDGQLIQVNKSQHCPYNVTQPSCGLLGFAVRINGDRCCPKWECACRCSLFSDLSFATFDGQYLALYKEASYIVTLTEDESITVQVSRCHHTVLGNVSDITLCLSMLELTYLSHQIIIDRLSRKVMVNSRIAWPMVRKYGYRILDTGNMYLIDTPSNVKIQWFHSTGLMIIESNSTSKLSSMGLCGLCDGNATNDLILPNGRVLTKSDDTEEFLDSWQVPYTLTYVGKERHQDLNCSAVDCSPCFQMILNQTFSSCHPYVSPESFCDLWVQDVDFIQDPCKALTAYTAMCHKFNVCIEWRSSEFCPFHCPESLVYRPCLPVCDVPRTCQNNEIDLYETESCSALTEGCVCAQGDILHRPYSAMCIPERKCACTDSAGVPREIGEMWNTSVSGCCMYKCVENDTIVPARYNCSDTREPGCRRYGEITVTVSDNKTCCPRHMCVCNQSVCDDLIPLCAPHEKVVTYYQEESCCPRYTCECDPDRCSTMEEHPRCREDQTLFVVPDNNTCCFRHFCGCSVCPQSLPTCQEGEILTITGNDTDRCCPIYQCVCDTSRCPDVTCDLGMSVLEMWTPGSCCPYRTCECSCDKVPKPECNLGEKLQINEEFTNSAANPCNCTIYKCVKDSVCVSRGGGVLRPGQTIMEHTSEGVCHTSHCTSVIDPVTRYHQINVSTLHCAANCQPNQVYEPPQDVSRCCGQCRNVSCVHALLNGTILTHRPGSSWITKCVRYDCTNTSVGPVLVTSPINCPPFNETECIKMGGYVVSFLEGCCKTCKEDGKFCKRVTVRMTIRKNDCRSNTPVNIVSCDGKCPSASIYNYNINTYARFCKCCRELGLQRRVVQLYCTGNATWVNYSIQEPTDCSCQWS